MSEDPELRVTQRELVELKAALDEHAIVAMTDTDGRITYANDKFCEISKYSREELLGQDHRIVNSGHHPKAFFAGMWATISNGKAWHGEIRNKAKDGSFYWVATTVVPLFDSEGRVRKYVSIRTDITERKRAEEQHLAIERKMLEAQKLESLGVLAGGVAHDFNNILCSVLGSASLAVEDSPKDSTVQGHLNVVIEGTKRAADLCKQLLAYSGKGRFVVENISLNRLVEDTTRLLQISTSKKAVLRYDLYRGLPLIAADATQIRQVVMNLVINASEAIGEKSGVISISTGLTRVDRAYLGGAFHAPELPDGNYVYLEVSDTGCGMDHETQSRIFDPFFTTKFSGRGLGLAAVMGIVRGHKGALKVYSELGRGTTFKMLFPRVEEGAEAVPADAEQKMPWRGAGWVMVIDDEESVRGAASAMLHRLGFEVALAKDGPEAIEACRKEPDRFQLFFLDLTMPHMSGESTFSELRRINPEAKVVLMSGFNEHDAVAQFVGKGLAGFLPKPFGVQDMGRVAKAATTHLPD